MTNDVDVWIRVNRERLLAGNDALLELAPYLDRSTDAEELRPMLVRLEGNASEITYSDFDRGVLSSAFGQAGVRLREGLGAIEQGDGERAGDSVSRGIWLYKQALDQTVDLAPDAPANPRRFPWGFLLMAIVLMVWLL